MCRRQLYQVRLKPQAFRHWLCAVIQVCVLSSLPPDSTNDRAGNRGAMLV
jgi:hypothetical protein